MKHKLIKILLVMIIAVASLSMMITAFAEEKRNSISEKQINEVEPADLENVESIIDNTAQESEYDQRAAVKANDALYSSFVFAETYVYPEDFAGTYLDKDSLHILLTSEDNLEHYRDIVSEYADNVTFDFVKYSNNELQNIVDEMVESINRDWISGWGVLVPENKGKIVLLDKYKEEFLKKYAPRVENDVQYIWDDLIIIEFVEERV